MTENVKRGLKCDSLWHLRKSGALAIVLYSKIAAITYDGLSSTYGTYHSSGRRLAEFFDADEDHVTSVLRKLKNDGWLEMVGFGPGTVIEEGGIYRNVKKDTYKPKNYRYVTHEEWAAKHPGKCYVRESTAWDDEEHDELAQSLHKHSFGMTFWHPNMLAGLRATGMSDAHLVAVWKDHVELLPKKPNGMLGWKRVALRFCRDLKNGQLVGAK